MLSPRPIGLDFRGFIGKNQGKPTKNVRRMNAARHLMSDARDSAEWPPVAKKMRKINPFVFWCQID